MYTVNLPDNSLLAAVVELVDTPDSKSCERKLVTVQVRPAAPAKIKNHRNGG